MKIIKTINLIAILLFFLGLSQMVGYLFNLKILRGLGAALTIAPFPKVFSDVDGIETFALTFILEYTDENGKRHALKITPEVYSKMAGPYNRRNVYGAALSYGPTPKFPEALFNSVFRYGLIDPGPLKNEFGIPESITDVKLRIRTQTKGRNDQWLLPREDK